MDKSEAITFQQGLRCHTMNAAFASFDEKELGSLEIGKKADFVIWNKDLNKISSASELSQLKTKTTFVGGKIIFEASSGV